MFGISKLGAMLAGLAAGVAGAAGGAAAAVKRQSALVFAILLYGITGVLIASMVVWWGQSVYDRYIRTDRTPPLGTVLIIGKSKEDSETLAKSVPAMVIAELNSLRDTINEAIVELSRFANEVGTGAALRPNEPAFENIVLPSEQVKQLELELKISDIDWGKTISSLFNLAGKDDEMSLIVSFGGAGEKPRYYGNVPADPRFTFSGDATTDKIADVAKAIASSIVQRAVIRQQASLESLKPDELDNLVKALSSYNKLQEASIRAPDKSKTDFNIILHDVEKLAGDWTGWPELQLFAARTAEQAGENASSVTYYRNVLQYAKLGEEQRKTLSATIARLERPVPPPDARESNYAKASKLLPDDIVMPLWTAIGMSSRGSAGSVKIGVVASPPWDEVIENAEVIPGTPDGAKAEADARDYAANIFQTIRNVADGGIYAFRGPSGTATTDAEITAAIGSLYQEGASVILLTYGGMEQSKAMESVVNSAPANTIIVDAAGNSFDQSQQQSPRRPSPNHIAVVSASNLNGERTKFTLQAEGGLWAPGEDLPIVDLNDGSVSKWSGTGPAAAVAAGAIAMLKSEFPTVEAARLLQVLRDTSVKRGSADVAVINVDAARKVLREGS